MTRVQGVDMNTGNQVDEYQCAIAWTPMLLIENSGQQRQTGAAVESFRNEMVKANETSQRLLLASIGSQEQLNEPLTIEVKPTPKVKPKPKKLGSKK
jgi:hypothetical protein